MQVEQAIQLKKNNEKLKVKVRNLQKKVVELDQQILMRCRNYMFKAQRNKNCSKDFQDIVNPEKYKRISKYKIQNQINLLIEYKNKSNPNLFDLKFKDQTGINLELTQKIPQQFLNNIDSYENYTHQSISENIQLLTKIIASLKQMINKLTIQNTNYSNKIQNLQKELNTYQVSQRKIKETNDSLKMEIKSLQFQNQRQKLQLQTQKEKIFRLQNKDSSIMKQIQLSKQRFTYMSHKMLENIEYFHMGHSYRKPEDMVDALENEFKLMLQIIKIYKQLFINVANIETIPENLFFRLENTQIFQHLFQSILHLSENANENITLNCQIQQQLANNKNETKYDTSTSCNSRKDFDNINNTNDDDQGDNKQKSINNTCLIDILNKRIYQLEVRQSTFQIIVQKWCKQNRQKDEEIDYLQTIVKQKDDIVQEYENEILSWKKSVLERDNLIKELNNQITLLQNSYHVKNQLVEKLKLENTTKDDHIKRLNNKFTELLNIQMKKSNLDILNTKHKRKKCSSSDSLNKQKGDNKQQCAKSLMKKKHKNCPQSQNIFNLSNMQQI